MLSVLSICHCLVACALFTFICSVGCDFYFFRSLEEGSYLDNRREGSMVDWATKGIPMQISHVRVRESDSADSFSPPPMTSSEGDHPQDQTRKKVWS